MRSERERARRGVTLIELVIVLSIMTVLAVVAVPRLSNAMQRERLSETARQVVSDIQAARSEAIRTKQKQSIIFEADLQQYRIGKFDRLPTDPQRIVMFGKEYGTAARLEQAEFNGSNELVFDRLGLPVEAGSIQLSGEGENAVLTVSPSSGRVTIDYSASGGEPQGETSPDAPPDEQANESADAGSPGQQPSDPGQSGQAAQSGGGLVDGLL